MATFYGLFKGTLDELIKLIIQLILAVLGEIAEKILFVIEMLTTIIMQILEAIFGPIIKFIMFLAGLIIMVLTKIAKVPIWLLGQIKKIMELVKQIIEMLAKIPRLPLEILALASRARHNLSLTQNQLHKKRLNKSTKQRRE